jgi:hypothetical protein
LGCTYFIHDVFFVDEYIGWVVGNMGLISTTVDGGNNWQIQNSGSYEDFKSVHFTNAYTGWTVCDYGKIWHTTDGGDIWVELDLGLDINFHDILFADENSGWIVGSSGTIFHNSSYVLSQDVNNIQEIGSDLLFQNYPNPFNPTTTIEFLLKNDSNVELSIYNIKGQKIKKLINNEFTKGNHSVLWSGDDESGKPISSGVYYYKLSINRKIEVVKKCLLLK